MIMRLIPTCLGVLLTCLPGSAQILNVPGQFATIQAAINAAVDGDTVLVAPGVYVANIEFLGKAITVRSSAGAAATIIDGAQTGTAVLFIAGEGPSSILEGFTITNGRGFMLASPPGGVGAAGAIHCFGASPQIRNCRIIGNFGGTGSSGVMNVGAIGGGGGIVAVNSSLVLLECEIIGNTGGDGGAGTCPPGMFGSATGGRGGAGGIVLVAGPGTARIERCVIEQNTGGSGGPGLCGVTFPGAVGGAGGPGGLDIEMLAPVVIADCVISNNQGGLPGSGVGAAPNVTGQPGEGGILTRRTLPGSPMLSLQGCSVLGNAAGSFMPAAGLAVGGIGGVHMTGNTSLAALHTTIAGNSGAPPSASGCTGGVGGVALNPGMFAANSLINCIVWGNTVCGFASDLLFIGFVPMVQNSDVGVSSGPFFGAGNFSADPMFANLSAGDIHLTAGSPCLHAGAANAMSPLFDLDGDPRSVGPAPDVGADEFDVLVGSREDFAMALTVNGAFAPGVGSTPAFPGDLMAVTLVSPGGTLAGALTVVAGVPWTPPVAPAGPPGFPELHLFDQAAILTILPGTSPAGTTLSAVVPGGLAGTAARFQAVVIEPMARNGFFAASAARDVLFQ